MQTMYIMLRVLVNFKNWIFVLLNIYLNEFGVQVRGFIVERSQNDIETRKIKRKFGISSRKSQAIIVYCVDKQRLKALMWTKCITLVRKVWSPFVWVTVEWVNACKLLIRQAIVQIGTRIKLNLMKCAVAKLNYTKLSTEIKTRGIRIFISCGNDLVK